MSGGAGTGAGNGAQRDYSVFEADIEGRTFDMQLLGRLLGWVKPHRMLAFGSVLMVLVASGLAVLAPVVLSRVVIDATLVGNTDSDVPDYGMLDASAWLQAHTGLSALPGACLLYGGLVALWMLFGHFHRILLARAALGALRDLRRDLFDHLESRPSSFYDRVAVGRVMTRVTNDVEVLFQCLTGLGGLIGEFIPFFVALFIMYSVSPFLTGVLLLAVPLVALATWLFRWATRSVYRDIRNSVSRLNQNLQENLSGIQVVQLHNRQERNLAQYTEHNRANRNHECKAIDFECLYGPFNGSLASGALGAIVWFGGQSVLEGAITLGSVVLFSRYVDMLFRPIVMLGEQYNVLYRAMASGERIFQALDWDESLKEPEHPLTLPERSAGKVEFRNLSFGYAPDQPVLHDVSFTIEPGEKVAIVGSTGSGKTTLIRLLGRFYDFEPNQILLDELDLQQLRTRDVRSRFGVVLQDFHIFSGTVRENIALGNPEVTDARVVEAARMVDADGFIRALPEGYDTPLNERGSNLSHGQRQLLAFARVLAADPEILVLDEATASIDTETEQVIQAALRRVTEGRTCILIAHRLQTIREADRIVVLQHGRVREVGSHEQLLAQRGVYHTLHELQFQETAG